MNNEELTERIADANPEALAYARDLLADKGGKDAKNGVSGEQFAAVWKGAILAAAKGKMTAALEVYSNLVKFQDYIDASYTYMPLLRITCDPKSEIAFKSVISTAAAAARMNAGDVPEGMDKEWYVKTAGSVFIAILKEGTDQSKQYAAELAANLESKEVLATLAEVAETDRNPFVRKAAGDTCGRHRLIKEIEIARDDHAYLLKRYDPDSPQTLFIDMMYTAIDTVLGLKSGSPENSEVKTSVLQLVSFTKNPEHLDALFSANQDQENMDIVRWSVENALLHALSTGSMDLKGKAVNGLARIGSDRIKSALETIIKFDEFGSDTWKAAKEARARIAGKGPEVFVLPPIKPVRRADMVTIQLPRKPTRQ
jgi:hypothetical protein